MVDTLRNLRGMGVWAAPLIWACSILNTWIFKLPWSTKQALRRGKLFLFTLTCSFGFFNTCIYITFAHSRLFFQGTATKFDNHCVQKGQLQGKQTPHQAESHLHFPQSINSVSLLLRSTHFSVLTQLWSASENFLLPFQLTVPSFFIKHMLRRNLLSSDWVKSLNSFIFTNWHYSSGKTGSSAWKKRMHDDIQALLNK